MQDVYLIACSIFIKGEMMSDFEVDACLPFVDGNNKTYASKMLECADRLQDYG